MFWLVRVFEKNEFSVYIRERLFVLPKIVQDSVFDSLKTKVMFVFKSDRPDGVPFYLALPSLAGV